MPNVDGNPRKRLIIVKLKSMDRAHKMQQICDYFGWEFIAGLELEEDLTDLKRAVKEQLLPAGGDVYASCPCGSGKKFKFCCGKLVKDFDIYAYIDAFNPEK